MKRSSILAHRGMFVSESEKNSPKALRRALDEGFGIETDLRDLDGRVVISHDPPRASPPPSTIEWLLEQIASSLSAGRIGLNIKSDGLAAMIKSELEKAGLDANQIFFFDMSVPDSLAYLKGNLPVYSRISDYEPMPTFLDMAKGVWIDNFNGLFQQVKTAKDLIGQGVRVAIVSPELHRRSHVNLWNEITEMGLHLSPLFELCTDLPMEAANRFCNA
ncbi:phosphodiesterase [Microcystis elabens FACHB-917]|nr:phosphodiesterase [Microcystis elabens FACHB-917]